MKYNSLAEAVQSICGQQRTITGKSPVFGGDINEAFRLTLDDGTSLFMKSNVQNLLPAFEAEEAGLQAIAGTGAIGTVRVLGTGTDPEGFSFLLQEFVTPGKKNRDYWERLGTELHAMHSAPIPQMPSDSTGNAANISHAEEKGKSGNPGQPEQVGKRFGFHADNFIGSRRQKNTWTEEWIPFFRDCRLQPQLKAAERWLDRRDRKLADSLLEHLDQYLIEPEKPSLIHGDLWAGNVMTGTDGRAWIIDPAAYYGHPEADLAMTELFGGFSPAFYDAYFACAKMEAGYRDRKDLYNLYHLLNHLNLFGSSYLSSVESILRRYGRT